MGVSVNFTGSWKADVSRSRFLGPPPTALRASIVHAEPELHLDMLVTKVDGSEDRVTFQCSTDGEPDKSRLGGKSIRGSAKWDGAELSIESWAQFGEREMHFCDYWSLSPDEQTLTMEHRGGDLNGQVVVLKKV